MKLNFFILVIMLSSRMQAQVKTFNLLDSSVTIGQEYTTRAVSFELGKADLKPESHIVLDSVLSFMNKNKSAKIEIQVHTDSRTNPICCSMTTQNRAQNISQYLINRGISIERIVAKGYGEVKLLIPDNEIDKAKTKGEKEALHSINRRVVLKIIGL